VEHNVRNIPAASSTINVPHLCNLTLKLVSVLLVSIKEMSKLLNNKLKGKIIADLSCFK